MLKVIIYPINRRKIHGGSELINEDLFKWFNIIIEPVPDYVKAVVDTALKIHEAEEPGDVLAFLTGMDEVDRAVSLLSDHANLIKEGRRKYYELAIIIIIFHFFENYKLNKYKRLSLL